MTDTKPATVEVPVELLRELLRNRDDGSQVYADVEALLPKPKPRLVAVNLDAWKDEALLLVGALRTSEPDLLTLLDSILEDEVMSPELQASIRHGIRAALGVDQ